MDYTKFVHSFLEDSADKYPDKDALFSQNRWYKFDYLNRMANQLAHLLIESGIKKGDRVALLIENSEEYVITYYAILKAGGITVALNTDSVPEDLAYVMADCQVKLLITSQKLLRKNVNLINRDFTQLSDIKQAISKVLVWSNLSKIEIAESDSDLILLPQAINTYPENFPDVRIIDLDISSIVYTSGSTGKPRGATLSHLNIVTNTRSIIEYLRLTHQDRVMAILPFYYIYGKSLLNTHFAVGGSVVIDNRFLYPNVVLQTMQEQKVTGFSGVPSTFTILLNRSNLRSQKFSHLRYITQAGGAMAPSVQKEVAEVFSPAQLFIMYGATEASARLSYLEPDDLPRKWGSIGKGIPNVDLFIADEKGNRLPPGKEGEIVARGANLMSGYWNHPEETVKVLRNGLYYTGDLGKMDDEGFIYVVGRTKDMIKIGGNRVSAKEIEEAIYAHPLVSEVAVIGVQDDVLGEAAKAFLVLNSNSNGDNVTEEISRFLKDHLAVYKIPKFYEIRDSLPKNESGKILKLELKRQTSRQ